MLLVVALLFPVALLLGTLGMERVERPLDAHDTSLSLERFLDAAELEVRPEEVETFVREGYSEALDRYWRRQRPGEQGRLARLTERRRRPGRDVTNAPRRRAGDNGAR